MICDCDFKFASILAVSGMILLQVYLGMNLNIISHLVYNFDLGIFLKFLSKYCSAKVEYNPRSFAKNSRKIIDTLLAILISTLGDPVIEKIYRVLLNYRRSIPLLQTGYSLQHP